MMGFMAVIWLGLDKNKKNCSDGI